MTRPPLATVSRLLRAAFAYVSFERRFRLRTSRVVEPEELGTAHPERVGHRASGWRTLGRILAPDEVSPEDVFVDFGSGMGRVVFLAARRYPFARVEGVEISPVLHAIAEANIARNRRRLRCRDVRLVNVDALDYAIPPDMTVAFFFNPFKGRTFAAVIGRVLASIDAHPRAVRLIYANPVEERILLDTGRASIVRAVDRGKGCDVSRSTRMYELR